MRLYQGISPQTKKMLVCDLSTSALRRKPPNGKLLVGFDVKPRCGTHHLDEKEQKESLRVILFEFLHCFWRRWGDASATIFFLFLCGLRARETFKGGHLKR
jgi:hypothetical protein